MSTIQTYQIVSTNSDDTVRLGERLGHCLRGGEVIELVSDVGGGKTTFVRGLARGAGSQDHVASPSFTISRLYKTSKFSIHHFDLYRLDDPGVITYQIREAADDPSDVVVVEWGNAVRGVLPINRLKIVIESGGHNKRYFTFHYGTELKYLLKDLK